MNMNKQSNINLSFFWLRGFADVESFAVKIVKSENNKLG